MKSPVKKIGEILLRLPEQEKFEGKKKLSNVAQIKVFLKNFYYILPYNFN